MREPPPRVEEWTGLYGPVFVEERDLQRLWSLVAARQGPFVTRSGRRLQVLDPGQWNHGRGPDFRDAILEVEGERRHGDVELHLAERDWIRHGHEGDPAFARVGLHVVLFPDAAAAGENRPYPPETLEWLPYLGGDVEGLLEEAGLRSLLADDLPPALAALEGYRAEDRQRWMVAAAGERWERKVALVRRRLADAEWTAVAHQLLLETLGLKRNRALMHRVALRFPLQQWRAEPDETAEAAWRWGGEEWTLSGVRPANHPRRRLQDYAAWIRAHPQPWPLDPREGVGPPAGGMAGIVGGSALLKRRPPRVAARRRELELGSAEKTARARFHPAVGGTRFHTWMTDGWLPLLAAAGFHEGAEAWFLWWPGDAPATWPDLARRLELTGPGRPLCNGWFQALLRASEPDYRLPPESSPA